MAPVVVTFVAVVAALGQTWWSLATAGAVVVGLVVGIAGPLAAEGFVDSPMNPDGTKRVDFAESGTGRPIRVKQISGAIARRIVCKLKVGDEVKAGDRYGMIKFGSRTDVLIPAQMAKEVFIKVGDKVRGAKTILLRVT